MSVSIIEALQNAEYNIQSGEHFVLMLAKVQLRNAITLLKKGYPLHTQVEPLLERYGTAEDVPDESERRLTDEEMELIAFGVAACPECGCAMDKYRDKDGSIILMCCGCEHIIRPLDKRKNMV